ncbi:MAG: GNAT family N-acetyltransferase [bacterium]
MALPSVQIVPEDKQQASLHTIALAFASDPFARWMLPNAQQYLTYFPQIVSHAAGGAFTHAGALSTESCEGAALWVPPGIETDEEAAVNLMVEALSAEKLAVMGEVLEQMESFHPQDDDCWYLAFIGVDPGHQNKGLGSALMKHMTARLDEGNCLGYLESSNPMNVSLYQRHGFEIVGEIQAADSPQLLPMIRPRQN